MPDTKRQQIVTALAARLALIQVANGYQTDAGLNVNEWLVTPLELQDPPALNFRDEEDVIELTTGKDLHTLTIAIECYATGSSSPATLRLMLADIVRAIAVDNTFGGLVEDTTISSESISVRQEEKRLAAVNLKILIQYETDHLNAYA